MRYIGRRCFFAFMALAIAYIIISGILGNLLSRGRRDPLFALENRAWMASSTNPIDKALCYWVGLCGGFHFLAGPSHSMPSKTTTLLTAGLVDQWTSGPDESASWSEEETKRREIPQYVFDYAPYVHLFSKEKYWPANVAEHIAYTSQRLNSTELSGTARGILDLDELNSEDKSRSGMNVYLQSREDVEGHPEWLGGTPNIPNGVRSDDAMEQEASVPERRSTWPAHRDLRRRRSDQLSTAEAQPLGQFGRSTAPAFLIVVPKDDGILDAIWFAFYSFNKAPKFCGIQFGNHVGDWEHTVVRFRNGTPESVAMSAHNFGSAYAYESLEKYLVNDDGDILGTWSNRTALDEAKRPVIYSAGGSHAMYPRPGLHPYILPFNLLRDETDRGPLWDPTLNLHAYTYDSGTIRAATRNPRSPTGWFNFNGRWGDKYYLLSDSRQYRFAGQYHYLSGPYGPKYKNLDRKEVCQNPDKCVVKDEVDGR